MVVGGRDRDLPTPSDELVGCCHKRIQLVNCGILMPNVASSGVISSGKAAMIICASWTQLSQLAEPSNFPFQACRCNNGRTSAILASGTFIISWV